MASDAIKLPPLEECCDYCDGEPLGRPCPKCNGDHVVPTEFGERVLALVRRNRRSVLARD